MLYSGFLIATAALTGLVVAQNQTLTIEPNSVEDEIRQSWCRAQTGSCPQICGGAANPNTCDASDLTFECVCTDGASPNISDYRATLPFFICEEWRSQCVARSPDDLKAQTACLSVQCGQRNASAESTSTSTSSAAEPTSTEESNDEEGSATATTDAAAAASSTAAASALAFAKSYGTGIFAAAVIGLFGLAI